MLYVCCVNPWLKLRLYCVALALWRLCQAGRDRWLLPHRLYSQLPLHVCAQEPLCIPGQQECILPTSRQICQCRGLSVHQDPYINDNQPNTKSNPDSTKAKCSSEHSTTYHRTHYISRVQWVPQNHRILRVSACHDSASEMTYIVSSGALNSTHSLTPATSSKGGQ